MRSLFVVAVLLSFVPFPASAQDTFPVTVTVYTPVEDGAEIGDECAMSANIDADLRPWPQLIATMANGVIVGYIDLMDGAVAAINDTTLIACAVSADMDLTPSPFYTFTVEDTYQRTVSDDVLTGSDHQLYVALF